MTGRMADTAVRLIHFWVYNNKLQFIYQCLHFFTHRKKLPLNSNIIIKHWKIFNLQKLNIKTWVMLDVPQQSVHENHGS